MGKKELSDKNRNIISIFAILIFTIALFFFLFFSTNLFKYNSENTAQIRKVEKKLANIEIPEIPSIETINENKDYDNIDVPTPPSINDLEDYEFIADHDEYSAFSEAYFDINSNNVLTISDGIIYKTGYYSLNGAAWTPFTLSGTPYDNYPWLLNSGSANLPNSLNNQGKNYVIVFSCSLANQAWECHGNKWQLEVINNDDEDECPEGQVLDIYEELDSFVTEYSCKPKITNLVAPEDLSYYLEDRLFAVYDKIWDDWRDYPPMKEKVEELIEGKTQDVDKVEAIVNWAHKSKTYGCEDYTNSSCIAENSPANSLMNFSEIFDSDVGVCLDASIVTSAMLRQAGIPAHPKMKSIYHIYVVYNADGLWYSVDNTFPYDINTANDRELSSKEEVMDRFFFIYSGLGLFELGNGQYCDKGTCLSIPFALNMILPLNNRDYVFEVYYPSAESFPLQNPYAQVMCFLEAEGFIKNSYGGYFGISWDQLEKKWEILPVNFKLSDRRNIGYHRIELPYRANFLNSEEGISNVNYRFICKSVFDQKIIALKEFTSLNGERIVITPNDLEMGEEIDEEIFNELILEMKSRTDDLGIFI